MHVNSYGEPDLILTFSHTPSILKRVLILKIQRTQGLCYHDRDFELKSSNKRTHGHLKRIDDFLKSTFPANNLCTGRFFYSNIASCASYNKMVLGLSTPRNPSFVPIWGIPSGHMKRCFFAFQVYHRVLQTFFSTPSIVPSKEVWLSSK